MFIDIKICLFFCFFIDNPEELSLGEWKYKLAIFEHCMITQSRRIQFEDWFQSKNFTSKDSIYQSWLVLKRASIGTETEALDTLLEEKIPKNLQKSKSKRNMNYPSGPARYDCTGPEWMDLMRSRRERNTSKKSTKKKKDLNNK